MIQKVAKELLADVSKGKVKYTPVDTSDIKQWNFQDLPALFNLFKIREQKLIQELGLRLKKKTTDGQTIFQVWMYQESDLIQDVGRAYGERVVFEHFLNVINKAPVKNQQVQVSSATCIKNVSLLLLGIF